MKPLMPIFVAALIAGSPCLAAADARLMVQPTGKDAFLLSGEDLEGYTSGEILLLYEANDGGLADVVVSSGLGALAGLRISSVSPGVVNFTMKSVRSMRDGTGPMAQIRLKGRITHLSGWLQNEEGSGTQPATEIVNPETQPGPVSPLPSSSDIKKDAPAVFRRIESAMDRFRAAAGEAHENPGVIADRVLHCENCGYGQNPRILLSDGSSAARVIIKLKNEARESPDFVISGGKCTLFQQGDSGEWIMEIIPEKGALNTSVTAITSREMIEYPLAVAPPLAVFDAARAEQVVVEFVRWANEAAIK